MQKNPVPISRYGLRLVGLAYRIAVIMLFWLMGLPISGTGQAGQVAESAVLTGKITDPAEAPLLGALVMLKQTTLGAMTDADGRFRIEGIPPGTYTLRIRMLGYRTLASSITFRAGERIDRRWQLDTDALQTETQVISGTRTSLSRKESPVLVHVLDNQTLETTQSISLSEGLNFMPGLRVETNCQNCGFTQVRLNGLEGPYTQILINSRPIFSSLTGVYGLEMIPANMIERVEVVRGGGSALYGANAIGGTLNIITRTPDVSGFSIGHRSALTGGTAPAFLTTAHGTYVTPNRKNGLTIYAQHRHRAPYDDNGDEFSELTRLDQQTFGLEFFHKPTERAQVRVDLHSIHEDRRGGNRLDVAPHQADVAESLEHRIFGGGVTYEQYTADLKHKCSVYASGQHVHRDSYYGAERDPDAYGQTEDLAWNTGLQYTLNQMRFLGGTGVLTAGLDYQGNDVVDEMPGIEVQPGQPRRIAQTIHLLGLYVQQQWKPIDRLTLLLGLRLDQHNRLDAPVVNPRISTSYDLTSALQLRATYATGFRAPQAFDEDLHIETVGGNPQLIVLSPELEAETSHSGTLSLRWARERNGKGLEILLEGFATRLLQPFILEETESIDGVMLLEKRNGTGAWVTGGMLEVRAALHQKLRATVSLTVQRSVYDQALGWSEDTTIPTTRNYLRTPNLYGYATLTYSPLKRLDLSCSGVFTGPMDVPHYAPAPEDLPQEYPYRYPQADRLVRSPAFMEVNLQVAYTFALSTLMDLRIYGGVQNVLNQYQDDFDRGIYRDAGYIYGPARPILPFLGIKLGTNL